jgi:hypothetical protein
MDELWSKFSLSLNWRAGRFRPWRGGGGAKACTTQRAVGAAAAIAPNREAGLTDS